MKIDMFSMPTGGNSAQNEPAIGDAGKLYLDSAGKCPKFCCFTCYTIGITPRHGCIVR